MDGHDLIGIYVVIIILFNIYIYIRHTFLALPASAYHTASKMVHFLAVVALFIVGRAECIFEFM